MPRCRWGARRLRWPATAPPAGRFAGAISTTSKWRARRTSSVAVEGRSHARQPRRLGAPTSTRVAWRVCAYSIRVSAADGPSSVTASPPSDSASRSTSMRRLRCCSERRSSQGVSTYTTVQCASSASAMRLPARTSCSACSSGPTATSSRSPAMRTGAWVRSAGSSREAASTRSATRRSAISRSAMRFCLRKKLSTASPAWSATYTLPDCSRAIRSSGGRSMSSMSSASSNTRSGRVSRWRAPVVWKIRSLRLSRCWTLTVVQTLMPAASSSSMSCQRFG